MNLLGSPGVEGLALIFSMIGGHGPNRSFQLSYFFFGGGGQSIALPAFLRYQLNNYNPRIFPECKFDQKRIIKALKII